MIVASIDIGTNTVLLLIARIEKDTSLITPLRDEYLIPRIGKGLKTGSEISNERLKLLFEVLEKYKKIVQSYSCEKVYLIGTNALRIAKNSQVIKEKIKEQYGFELEIISGDQEAEYAYHGATSGLENVGSALVIDIGGGSTEIIIGNKENIVYKKSFNIGSVSATENYLGHSPPLPEEEQKLINKINEVFLELKESINPDVVIATSGTATTLSCMNKRFKEFQNEIEGSYLETDELKILIKKMEHLTSAGIKENYGDILKGREDVIYAGALILHEIMKMLNVKKVMISAKGIRYGVIVSKLKGKN
jgi:exopolyphosphatase/guanosine-5'-triphosphate,3'-diphosphate pyrophosphatase